MDQNKEINKIARITNLTQDIKVSKMIASTSLLSSITAGTATYMISNLEVYENCANLQAVGVVLGFGGATFALCSAISSFMHTKELKEELEYVNSGKKPKRLIKNGE